MWKCFSGHETLAGLGQFVGAFIFFSNRVVRGHDFINIHDVLGGYPILTIAVNDRPRLYSDFFDYLRGCVEVQPDNRLSIRFGIYYYFLKLTIHYCVPVSRNSLSLDRKCKLKVKCYILELGTSFGHFGYQERDTVSPSEEAATPSRIIIQGSSSRT